MDECSHIISQNQGSFLWTPEDVEMKEITQIGTSACGATAVLNILVCARCIHADVCTVFNKCTYPHCIAPPTTLLAKGGELISF